MPSPRASARRRGLPVRWLVAAALLVLVALLIVGKSRRRSPSPGPTSPPTSLAEPERARVRSFWDRYREGIALKNQGRWDEAIEAFREAARLDPDHEDTLYYLGNCYFETDRFAEALSAFERLVAINPMSLRGHLQIGAVRSCPAAADLFDLEAAERSLERALEINQEETGSLLRLGEVALVRGEVERAYESLALANRSNFRAVEGYYLRAYMAWKADRQDEARSLLEDALVQSRKPAVVAGVPGEGDTRAGDARPPTTLREKRLLVPVWEALPERYPDGAIGAGSLADEFGPLEANLKELERRIEAR